MPAQIDHITIDLPLELHEFVRLVLRGPEHQRRLAPLLEDSAFITEAQILAAEKGIALDRGILADVLKPDLIGAARYAPAPILSSQWPPDGWIPTRSVPTGAAPAFDWLWFGDRQMTKSFFEDEVRGAAVRPFNWLFRIRTNMDALISGAGGADSAPLKGIIFHMSRCGSTLVAQMFAALPDVIVCSEPEPLDAVMNWIQSCRVETATATTALQSIIAALGRTRGTGATAYIIKTDAWHSLALPLFRAAFPTVNWVYLFRDSVEVLVSMANKRGIHMLPNGPIAALANVHYDPDKPLDDYGAKVLARYGEAVLAHWDLGGGMLVDYPEIIAAAPTLIADHFDLVLDPAQIARMAAAAGRDSKMPRESFTSDSAAKQAAASDVIRQAAALWMDPVERQLRALKASIQAG
jgi:hypothetical protein